MSTTLFGTDKPGIRTWGFVFGSYTNPLAPERPVPELTSFRGTQAEAEKMLERLTARYRNLYFYACEK